MMQLSERWTDSSAEPLRLKLETRLTNFVSELMHLPDDYPDRAVMLQMADALGVLIHREHEQSARGRLNTACHSLEQAITLARNAATDVDPPSD